MSTTPSPIILITGPPGAGKSSIALHLLQQFPRGFHIPIDDLREWVVAGMAHPVPEWTVETTRQFHLARRAATQLAELYATAGFAVAIDDIITAQEVEDLFAATLHRHPLYKVLLLPTAATALHRNRTRTNKHFDTALLVNTIQRLHHSYSASTFPSDWLVLDNSTLTIEETVDRIMSYLS